MLHDQGSEEAHTVIWIEVKLRPKENLSVLGYGRKSLGKQVAKLCIRKQTPKSTKTAIHAKHQENVQFTHQMRLSLATKYLLESQRGAKQPSLILSYCSNWGVYKFQAEGLEPPTV